MVFIKSNNVLIHTLFYIYSLHKKKYYLILDGEPIHKSNHEEDIEELMKKQINKLTKEVKNNGQK